MAEFSKYKAYSIGRLLLHNNRVPGDGVTHSNQEIDTSRTMYNYNLKRGSTTEIKDRLSEIFYVKTNTNSTVLGEMIVTLPKNVKPEDERAFFNSVYDFYANDFGEENIVNAVVHKDEKTPHIHLDFLPVVHNLPEYKSNKALYALKEWKKKHNNELPTERLCCKDLINRQYLKNMHPRLSDYVEHELGYHTDILNGATANGNKTVLQLKVESLKKETEELEKKKLLLNNDINKILEIARINGLKENDIGCYPLIQKIDDLNTQNSVLREIIVRNGYNWKKEDLQKIQNKRYDLAESSKVNVKEGIILPEDISVKSLVVIDLPNNIERELPQQHLIDSPEMKDLQRQISFIKASEQPVIIRPSRLNNNYFYAFIKSDNTKEVIDNLITFEQKINDAEELKKIKIFMERLEFDEYDFGYSILVKNQFNSVYYDRNILNNKNKGIEKSLQKEI